MKFFTKAWLIGEVSDEASDAVFSEYRQHTIGLRLPQDVAKLTQLNLHDG